MKVSDLDQEIEREQHLDALGDAIAETIGTPAPGAAGSLPEEVERVLTRRPRRKLRPAWKWAPPLALCAGVAAFFVLRTQPLDYQLSGSYAAREDAFETPGNGTATARFSDGTSIAVGTRSVARVPSVPIRSGRNDGTCIAGRPPGMPPNRDPMVATGR